MYDKLIKRLRAEVVLPYATLSMIREAADAIEDLIAALTASNEVIAKNKRKAKTNADRIRAMTDEELARYIVHLVKQGNRQAMADYECGLNWLKDKCDECFFDWLKKWGGT